MSFWSSFCSGVSTAWRATVTVVSNAAVTVGKFCREKVVPVLSATATKIGEGIETVGKKLQKWSRDIISRRSTRDEKTGQLKTEADGEREREIIESLRCDANESFGPIVSDMLMKSAEMYNDMKQQWEAEFKDLDLSRESYDTQKSRQRLRNAVKDKIQSEISPSCGRFKDIMRAPAGSAAREEAYNSFLEWILKKVQETFDETVDAIFSEQIKRLFDKVEDYITMNEKQSQNEVSELKKIIAEEESGVAAKAAVIAESCAMLQKCDYLADVLETN